ncbi:hypothetical protein MMPV_000997 [Pyropia vietnamensis]
MAEAIHSATVGVVDKIAAVTTGIADKLGATTPSSQTSLAPHPPSPPAEHVNPPRPEHVPPGGTLPVAQPPPLPAGAKALAADGKEVTPVGAGAAVAQPVAAVSVVEGKTGAASATTPPAAVIDRSEVPVVPTRVAVPVQPVPTEAVASATGPTTVASAVADDGRRTVRFRWMTPTTSSVVVKGSWDNWVGEVDCSGEGGEVALLPGTYTWKYVVDGEYVCGKGSNVIVDAEGNSNHVLTVE